MSKFIKAAKTVVKYWKVQRAIKRKLNARNFLRDCVPEIERIMGVKNAQETLDRTRILTRLPGYDFFLVCSDIFSLFRKEETPLLLGSPHLAGGFSTGSYLCK